MLGENARPEVTFQPKKSHQFLGTLKFEEQTRGGTCLKSECVRVKQEDCKFESGLGFLVKPTKKEVQGQGL